MSVNGLVSTLAFGAVAAITSVFIVLVTAPWLSPANVLTIYWIASLVAYASLLGTTPRRRARNFFVALGGGAVAALLARSAGTAESTSLLVVGLTIVLAIVRSGLELEMRSLRGFLVESVLGLAALSFAAWLAVPSVLGSAAAIWGFALVQSLYFLVPGRLRARRFDDSGDPFDRARERLDALLEEV